MMTVACAGGKQDVRLALVSTRVLNTDDSGAALPVVVRVYQLRNRDAFDRASFRTLWKDDRDLLQGDLIERREIVLHPDSEVVVELKVDRKKGAAYLGVVALFRKPSGDSWKKIVPTEFRQFSPFTTPEVRIVVRGQSIALQ